jgi:hypothetical protein
MRKVLLGILAAVVAVAVVSAPASAQRVTKIGVIEIRKARHHHGNVNTARGLLVHRGVPVGHDVIKFTVLGHRRARLRAIAYFTGRGSLKVKGVISGRNNNNRLPIIGGTGAFNGAAGKVKVNNLGHQRAHLTFVFVQ